jgi:hypothetical protein
MIETARAVARTATPRAPATSRLRARSMRKSRLPVGSSASTMLGSPRREHGVAVTGHHTRPGRLVPPRGRPNPVLRRQVRAPDTIHRLHV